MITLKKGDITLEEVDVIVNAANSSLKGGGGVDGAIHRAAGPSVLEECILIGGCNTGSAVITGAGRLKTKKIIHTVGPVWSGGKRRESQLLESCYTQSLRIASQKGLKSIAFSSISTGAYQYPLELAANIALSCGKQYESLFYEIRYICFAETDLVVYNKVLNQLLSARGS